MEGVRGLAGGSQREEGADEWGLVLLLSAGSPGSWSVQVHWLLLVYSLSLGGDVSFCSVESLFFCITLFCF